MAAAVQSGLLSINVCGMPCHQRPTESNADIVTWRVPYLANVFSNRMYDIVESSELDVTFEGTADDMTVLSDGLNTVDSVDSTESGCTVQANAGAGKTFMLDAVRIFFNQIQDRTPYTDGNLELQGYKESTGTWETIHQYTDDIHEGWYSLDWRTPE